VALGLAAYGSFMLSVARYHRVHTGGLQWGWPLCEFETTVSADHPATIGSPAMSALGPVACSIPIVSRDLSVTNSQL